MAQKRTLFTIGHSNRTFEELVALLQAHRIEQLIDVRAFPNSRANPQFNKASLGPKLRNRSIGYRHERLLGGRRKAQPHSVSVNTAWRNRSFQNYADFMQTPEFKIGLKTIFASVKTKRTVIMCSEALPWRCHRNLIADALTVRGWEIRHIMTRTSSPVHKLTSFAKVSGRKVTYPAVRGIGITTLRNDK